MTFEKFKKSVEALQYIPSTDMERIFIIGKTLDPQELSSFLQTVADIDTGLNNARATDTEILRQLETFVHREENKIHLLGNNQQEKLEQEENLERIEHTIDDSSSHNT